MRSVQMGSGSVPCGPPIPCSAGGPVIGGAALLGEVRPGRSRSRGVTLRWKKDTRQRKRVLAERGASSCRARSSVSRSTTSFRLFKRRIGTIRANWFLTSGRRRDASRRTRKAGGRQDHDLGEGRIAAMDAAGIDVQILSTSPGPETLEPSLAVDLARQANDDVAVAVSKYPERFLGFATLPMRNPQAAASELERVVRDQGFVGT